MFIIYKTKIKRYEKIMTYKIVNSRKRIIRPQSAMLTLYGDYLLDRGEEIGIGSLITLFNNFGLSEQAVRSAVSRMCHAGLLKARSEGRKSYYSLTTRGHNLLSTGAQRIFVRKDISWNGTWNIVTYTIPEEDRKIRDTLRRELIWMGYGTLSGATMISPYDLTEEVVESAKQLGMVHRIHIFQAREQGLVDAKEIVSSCWDLIRIHDMYSEFLEKYQPRYEDWLRRLNSKTDLEASEFFLERFLLIHEYRKLPFYDPDLPEELLPEDWLRPKAATLFQEFHDLLTDKATEYFISVMEAYS
jgi:phenylacetic acid degradation operon negative regulatory protein